MKKISIGIIALVIIVSIFFNIKQFQDLQSAKSLEETLQSELIRSEKLNDSLKDDSKVLEENYNNSQQKVAEIDQQLSLIEEELRSANDLIEQIDNKLEGNGDTIEKIEEFLAENDNLKRQIAKLTTTLDEIRAESLESEDIEVSDSPKDEVSEPVVSLPTDKWSSDVLDVIVFLENRVVELETASDPLPTLSIERILINQEIELLNEAISDLVVIQDGINSYN